MFAKCLVAASLMLLSPPADASGPACPAVAGLSGFTCATSQHGRVYARDADEARLLADDLTHSAIAFQRYFSRKPPSLAIVLTAADESLTETDRQQLVSQGADLALAWPGHNAHADMMRNGIQADGAAARALAANPQLQQMIWRNVTRHELGHIAFNLAFWPGYVAQRGHGHTSSPDWLNEMAAMLQEPETAADHRRRLLAHHLASEAPTLPALSEFLSMRNPARPPADQPPPSTRGVALVYRGDTPGTDQQASALYYAQVQAFADFLVDTTPAGTIGAIATAIANGRSFPEWITASGPTHRLPSDFSAVEALWHAWLKRRAQ